MVERLLNESLDCLLEAGVELSKMQDIDEFQLVFEANTEEVKSAQENNTKSSGKAQGLFSRAINALKRAISEIAKAIQDFLGYTFASPEKKAAFNRFKQACLEDPNLRNTKISYTDYTQLMDQYAQMIAEGEKIEKELEAGRNPEVEAYMNRANELMSGVAKGIATSVGLQAIEKIMEQDVLAAKGISLALKMDSRILENIEKQIGAGGAKRFEKYTAQAAGERLGIRRIIIHFRRKQDKTIQQQYQELLKDLKRQCGSKWGLIGSVLTGGVGRDLMGNKAAQDIMLGKDDVSKGIRDTGFSIAKNARKAKARGMFGGANQNTSNFVQQMVDKREMKKLEKNKKVLGDALTKAKKFYFNK